MNDTAISRRALLLSHIVTGAMVLLPVGAIVAFATKGVTPEALQVSYGITIMPAQIAPVPTLVWFAVEAVKMGVLIWVLWCLRTWLMACAQGQVFAARSSRHIQRIGFGLVLLGGAHVLGHTIAVLALTWGNPVGQRSLAIALGSTELVLFFAAGLVTLFGWIQAEAARLASENEGFV